MKILFVIDKLKIGGKAMRFLEIVRGLSLYHHIIIIAYDINIFYDTNENIKIIYLKRRGKYNFFAAIDIYNVIKSEKPDVVHSWSTFATIYCFPSKVLRKFKLIDNSVASAETLSKYSKKQILSLLSYIFSDIIIANSQAGIISYRVPASKSLIINNGFDFKRILTLNKKFINTKVVEGEEAIRIGMVARFDDNKDYDTFLDAAKELSIVNKRIKFYAIGNGTNLDKYKIRYKDLNNVIFTGAVKNPLEIISKFDICVLTTYTEGISNTLMEYMALSKPIITSDCPGTRELISPNEEGILISVSSVQELVKAILYLLDNLEVCLEMGKKAYYKLETNFSYSKMIGSYLNLYENI